MKNSNLDTCTNHHSKNKNECGAMIVLFAFVLSTIIAIAALVDDIGRGFQDKRDLQNDADAASLAGIIEVENNTPGTADAVAVNIASENNLKTANPGTAITVAVGAWDENSSIFTALPSSQFANANAVSVTATRTVPTTFARIIGFNTLQPTVRSISYLPITTTQACVKPFGIENTLIDNLNSNGTLNWGTTVVNVDSQSPGNWGKLDLGANMSSGNNFYNAMVNGVCNPTPNLQPGVTQISPGTGFAQNYQAFYDLYNSPDPHDKLMVIAKVTPFPNGNHDVTYLSYVEVEIDAIYPDDKGKKWNMDLKLLREFVDLSTASQSTQGDRTLIR